MHQLLLLATEIILSIVERVDDPSDLISLAQTCTNLQPIAEAELFKAINVRNGKHAQNLSKVLHSRPERFKHVQRLEATPTRYRWEGIQIMPSLVRKMTNLHELHIESPLCNGAFSHWWVEESEAEYINMFREANGVVGEETPLRNLRRFKYHSHGIGSRFSDILTVLPIFLSRTLSHIHISCIHVSGPIDVPSGYQTPLKTLILEECAIDPSTLHTLLSLPRALNSLYLQESYRASMHDKSTNDNLDETICALRQQKHSLQFLQHICPPGREKQLPSDGPSFSDFLALARLELSCKSRLTKTLEVPHLVPPALGTYCLTDVDFDDDGEWETMITPLQQPGLHLELHRTPQHGDPSPLLFMNRQRAQKIVRIARLMKERRITTTLVTFQKFYYIPPYLFNEEPPAGHVDFESTVFWEEEKKYEKELAEAKHDDDENGEPKVVSEEDSGTVIAAKILAGYQVKTFRSASRGLYRGP
ncbi:hypothetical protein K505DRAFT_119732 [Melanomma pulvis-pyrius CBS 109.77]|uniref:F-box domain-containing protein n=1 Tax=Melanomma pulvis-pyrius CBS 109.77 TaxID=1314802 RepID=A0A6A6XQF3_9PLEO|nr:hypothetical protein K505DRAFT_119732 [Melanomma pulvis-pyrius CBS 109.77]